MNTDSAIETPTSTIVFHTKKPFAAFDYLAQQPNTMPVPKDKDTGAKYRNRSSPAVRKFADLQPGKSFNLVRNDQWDPRPTRIARRFLIASRSPSMSTPTISTTGSQRRPRRRCPGPWSSTGRTKPGPAGSDPQRDCGQPARTTRLNYTSINPTVAPLDNIECRKAIMYAMDHTAYQTAYGGPFAGGTWQPRFCRPHSGP